MLRPRLVPLASLALLAALALPGNRADAHGASHRGTVVWFDMRPELVVVAPGFQVVLDYDREVFVYGGWWWTHLDGHWYRASAWDAPWVAVHYDVVPRYLRGVPRGYYRHYRPVRVYRDQPVFHDHRGHYHGLHGRPVSGYRPGVGRAWREADRAAYYPSARRADVRVRRPEAPARVRDVRRGAGRVEYRRPEGRVEHRRSDGRWEHRRSGPGADRRPEVRRDGRGPERKAVKDRKKGGGNGRGHEKRRAERR